MPGCTTQFDFKRLALGGNRGQTQLDLRELAPPIARRIRRARGTAAGFVGAREMRLKRSKAGMYEGAGWLKCVMLAGDARGCAGLLRDGHVHPIHCPFQKVTFELRVCGA